MKTSDRVGFRQLLTGIGLLYGKTLHEAVLEIWWEALKHGELSEVKAALNAHVINPDKGQFMPKPADVIAYHSVIFPDLLIHRVIRDMGGWIGLCQSPASEHPFRAKEFEKRYRALVLHPPSDCPGQLTGILEQQNRLGGYPPPDPVLIEQTPSFTLLETS